MWSMEYEEDMFGPAVGNHSHTGGSSHATLVPLLLAIGGGTFMGLYPSFIKTKAVLAADVHPVVFQLYKSTMVFITGWFFLIPRAIKYHKGEIAGDEIFVFSWWAVISAMFWVPSGLLTITSVPMIGMGMQVAVSCAANSILSFLVFWLAFDSKMKEYPVHGHPGKFYYRAPIYLAATVLGMVALVFAEKLAVKLGMEKKKDEYDPATAPLMSVNDDAARGSKGKKQVSAFVFSLGLFLSIMCGVFAAAQFGVITVGKGLVYTQNNCSKNHTSCPAKVVEEFDNHGSWLVSFGIGAISFTLILLSIASVVNVSQGKPRPSLQWNVLRFAGVGAGACWALANFLQLAAVVAGGNAIIMAQTLSAQIIASGLFGMLYYKEGGGKGSKVVWTVAALWTLGAMVLLGLEKGKAGKSNSTSSDMFY